MSDPIVTIDRLHKVYEPFSRRMRILLRTSIPEPVVALNDVSLQVVPGDVTAVLGPNGAGKSTLFRILTGLTTPTQGSASILGFDVTTESAKVRKLVGFMPAENRTLMLRHSCRENLAFHGRLQGIEKRDLARRVDETLDLVGLADARDRVGFALSSGMLARLLLARAILHRPPVLILDEPTGPVDPIGSFQLLGLIQQVAKEASLAVLISSHRLDEVELLNEKVLLLDEGKVVYSGDLETMVSRVSRQTTEIRLSTPEAAADASTALRSLPGVHNVTAEDDLVFLTTDLPIGQIVSGLGERVDDLTAIGEVAPRLRDVLTEMLRQSHGEES